MPGDDLIILAVQQILVTKPCKHPAFVSAVLLESAMNHSPYNSHLKFAAMDVFHQLDSTIRSWELYQSVGMKHIQLESCSYIIFRYLFEGGLYNEAIDLHTSFLRFQNSTARDCGDFTSRAMNTGTLTKANEFMTFQRTKMNVSLTSLYSKGMILDAAPLMAFETTAATSLSSDNDNKLVLKGGIGITQGIVGGNEDSERATQMVHEIHNPHAALSLVTSIDRCGTDACDGLSDNRDFSILKHFSILLEPRIESTTSMIQTTRIRGLVHGLLVRAALCVDALRGPKKGKLIKPGTILEKRTQSLLGHVLEASEFIGAVIARCDTGRIEFLHTFLALCRVLAMVNSGMPKIGDDSIEYRESESSKMIRDNALSQFKMARDKVSQKCSPKIIGSILPNYLLPIFALYRMCSKVCNAYGWGKRKTKIVSLAMADFSNEFIQFLKNDLISSLNALSSSEDDDSSTQYCLNETERNMLDENVVNSTKRLLRNGQLNMRMRIEPILEEMIDFLKD